MTRFLESGGEIENFVFLEYINVSQGKNYIAFLILHEATCMQKLREFQFLSLAEKKSFLFDFCAKVLLNTWTSFFIDIRLIET